MREGREESCVCTVRAGTERGRNLVYVRVSDGFAKRLLRERGILFNVF